MAFKTDTAPCSWPCDQCAVTVTLSSLSPHPSLACWLLVVLAASQGLLAWCIARGEGPASYVF